MTTAQELPNGPSSSAPDSTGSPQQREIPSASNRDNSNNQPAPYPTWDFDIPPSRQFSTEKLPTRCQFEFSDGRQCRLPRHEVHPCLCTFHAQREDQLFGHPADIHTELDLFVGDLTTATGVNHVLSEVFRLYAQRRITREQTVAFGYIAQLLLQTVAGVRAEKVAANGYKSWAANLQSTLAAAKPQASFPKTKDAYQLDGTLCTSRATGSTPLEPVRPAPEPAAVALEPVRQALAPEPLMPPPDFGDLLNRSLDLFDGKYDVTPEGRREAERLLFDLKVDAPPKIQPPPKRLGIPYDPFKQPKPTGTLDRTVAAVCQVVQGQAAESREAPPQPGANLLKPVQQTGPQEPVRQALHYEHLQNCRT